MLIPTVGMVLLMHFVELAPWSALTALLVPILAGSVCYIIGHWVLLYIGNRVTPFIEEEHRAAAWLRSATRRRARPSSSALPAT
jgi:cell division protein FtsW (lipid II flippase)